MASIFSLLLTLTFLSPIPFSSAISPDSIHNAAEVLSNTGFNSISLTLPLISTTLRLPDLPSATLFSPSDSSFSSTFSSGAGQPSLSTLQFHFCPRFYSYSDLQSLSSYSRLPTLLPNNSLTITSSLFDDEVTINGVKVNPDPLFDDGFFIVYEIDRFLYPNLTSTAAVPTTSPNDCASMSSGKYNEASAALRLRGYSLMAAFLDLQLVNSNNSDEVVLTVFAPSDVAMEGQIRNNDYSIWGSVFLRHVVGCELSWGDLIAQLDDEAGFVLPTFLDGFKIKVTRSSGDNGGNNNKSAYSLLLNGAVSVDSPEFYKSDGIVVHGLSGVLVAPPPVPSSPSSPSSSSSGYPDGGENFYSPAAGNGIKVDADHIEF